MLGQLDWEKVHLIPDPLDTMKLAHRPQLHHFSLGAVERLLLPLLLRFTTPCFV